MVHEWHYMFNPYSPHYDAVVLVFLYLGVTAQIVYFLYIWIRRLTWRNRADADFFRDTFF